MSGYAAGPSQILPLILESARLQQEGLNSVLGELQAQSRMQAQAFDLYDGPEGYRTTNEDSISPSPSP